MPSSNPAIEALHELRSNWDLGGDMGQPNGFLARRGRDTFAIKLELWTDDCLDDLKTGGAAAARQRGTKLAKQWGKEGWPCTGYVELYGAEGAYGATWAWDRAKSEEVADTDPEDIVRLAGNDISSQGSRQNPATSNCFENYWKLRKSSRPGKKWMTVVPSMGGRSRTIHFGDSSMEDFTMHGDKRARARYRSRHRGDNILDPYSPGFWSWHVLWGNSPDIKVNFAAAVALANQQLDKIVAGGRYSRT